MIQSLYGGLTVWTEARGEALAGRAAVAQVIRNRTLLKYESDGTIQGTALWPSQFDAFWFDYVQNEYQRVCHTAAEAEARAELLFKRALGDPSLKACQSVFDQVWAGTFQLPPGIDDKTVLFLNPNLVGRPSWASPDKLDAKIGCVEFFHA